MYFLILSNIFMNDELVCRNIRTALERRGACLTISSDQDSRFPRTEPFDIVGYSKEQSKPWLVGAKVLVILCRSFFACHMVSTLK